MGTLAYGKDASLFISEGDVLDIKTNNVTYAFIQGKNWICAMNSRNYITGMRKNME